MKKTFTLFLFFLCLISLNLSAQVEYKILLSSGEITPSENIQDFVQNSTIADKENYDGYYYQIIQFFEVPTNAQHQQITQSGIQLLEYLPHRAYIAAIPVTMDPEKLVALNVRSVLDISLDFKISNNLKQASFPDWAIQRERVEVMVKYYKNIRQSDLLPHLVADGIEVERFNGYNNFFKASIKKDKVAEIAALPYVSYLELGPAPAIADDDLGRSLHRANMVDASYTGGRSYTGAGLGVLVRDDGGLGPHIDYQGRLYQEFITGGGGGTHGDGVAGLLAGAGNFNPMNRGMAAGADIHALNYQADHLDETMDLFFNDGVLVTNSSYSNGCNGGYTTITETVDQQIFDNPTLLHVFSAGNSNNSDCGYGAGDQWGNITGGHKIGKNVIATANLNADATLVASSSRGPASDGRIKPDISANGRNQISTDPNNEYSPFGGTSAAAPCIAGVTAQLHDAHRQLNGGVTAESALLKAVLLNSANDLGNVGPDFKYGWGHVNALRAVETLEQGRYFTASVDPGSTNTHDLVIPADVLQAKVMIYWKDQEGSTSAAIALVNNLDAQVLDPSGNINQPWILDHTPNPVTLDMPATTGIDSLNNVEQIAMNNPVAGTYTIEVTGTELPFGTHEYYVIYEFMTEDIKLTYPVGGEGFVPGETERIHWDAFGDSGGFDLEYSTDGGGTWTTIGTANAADRMFNWTVPNDFTGEAKVRITRGTSESISEANFSISTLPTGLEVLAVCPDYIELGWNEMTNATSYQIYALGNKYMDSVGVTSDLTIQIPIANPADIDNEWYFAMSALGPNELESRRTIAIYYPGGFFNCVLQNDINLSSITNVGTGNIFSCDPTFSTPLTIEIMNTGLTDATDFEAAFQLDGQAAVVETVSGTLAAGESMDYTFTQALDISTSGNYDLTSWVSVTGDNFLPNDTTSINFELSLLQQSAAQLDVVETFESGVFPPALWTSINDDNDEGWEPQIVTQADGTIGTAARVNNYSYQAASNTPLEDLLFTIPVDLTSATNPFFSFDIAYTYYQSGASQFLDGLRVELSDDCGTSFTEVIYDEFGEDLITVPAQSGVFTPDDASQWRNEVIDLTPYIGDIVMIRFINISGYGNNLHIDNINYANLVAPVADFSSNATTVCEGETVTLVDNSTGALLDYDWDFGNSSSPSSSTSAGDQQVIFNTSGMVTVSLTTTNPAGSSSSSLTFDVQPLPQADYTFSLSDNTSTFSNASTNGDSYNWDFGDGMTSTDENPTHVYDAIGTYTVTLTITNDCGSSVSTQTVDVLSTSIFDPNVDFDLIVLPNPNNGVFEMVIESSESDELNWNMYNLQGQSIQEGTLEVAVGTTRQVVNGKNMPAGIYYLRLQNEVGYKTLRVVIQ
ncbi:MAG: S8 family serine peptidase [Saprospiraceae bacterium]